MLLPGPLLGWRPPVLLLQVGWLPADATVLLQVQRLRGPP